MRRRGKERNAPKLQGEGIGGRKQSEERRALKKQRKGGKPRTSEAPVNQNGMGIIKGGRGRREGGREHGRWGEQGGASERAHEGYEAGENFGEDVKKR
eukprot:1743935-Pleurochrysis_carterae.AAC.2